MKKEAIFPEALPRPRVAYSPAVKAGPFVFISGQVASDFQTGIPPAATINPNFPHHGSNIERQTRYIANNLRATLEAAGSSLEQCVSFTLYHTHTQELHGASEVLQQTFGSTGVPPHTTVLLEELPVPGCTLETDLVGFVSETGQRPEVIQAEALPPPAIHGLGGQTLYHLRRESRRVYLYRRPDGHRFCKRACARGPGRSQLSLLCGERPLANRIYSEGPAGRFAGRRGIA